MHCTKISFLVCCAIKFEHQMQTERISGKYMRIEEFRYFKYAAQLKYLTFSRLYGYRISLKLTPHRS